MLEFLKFLVSKFQGIDIDRTPMHEILRERKKNWIEWATKELKKESIWKRCVSAEEPFYMEVFRIMCMRGRQEDGTKITMKVGHTVDFARPDDTPIWVWE